VAGEAFYHLAQRATPGLLEIVRDPATNEGYLEIVLLIASVYVKDPEILEALRTRAQALPDPEERKLRLEVIQSLSTTPGFPYPR
jgi:broad specificity phosphatase PhoE